MSKRVPRKESDLIAFTEGVISGLKSNPKIFANPPVSYEELTSFVERLNTAQDNVAKRKSDYEAAIEIKDKNVKTLRENAIVIADFCYRISKDDRALLAKVGLTPRGEKKVPEEPGQCPNFAIVKQEIGTAIFRWKHPANGGSVRAYIVQRKEAGNPDNVWNNVRTEITRECQVKNQPEGKTFEFRVRALNAVGIGTPSNVVTIKF